MENISQTDIPQSASNNNTDKKQSKKILFAIIVTFLITTILLSLGFYYYHSSVLNKLNTDIQLQKESFSQATKDLNKEIEILTCKGVWDEAEGCVPYLLTLISPNGGESICIGETFTIKWKGPADMETVSIWLSTPQGNTEKIVETLAVNNVEGDVGFGEFEWEGTKVFGAPFTPKNIYKVNLNTNYDGVLLLDSSDDLLELKNCAN